MSHCHESCISRFLLLRGLVGCKGMPAQLVLRRLQGPSAEASTGSAEASKAILTFRRHMAPKDTLSGMYGRLLRIN
jgi:hypothetical protein